MKRILLATTAAAFVSTAAFADTQLRTALENEFQALQMNIDFDSLSDAQMSELFLIATSTDTHGEKSNKIQTFLEDTDYLPMVIGAETVFMPRNSIREQVSNDLPTYGYSDADISELSDAEIAELYISLTSDSEADIRKTVDSVLQ